VLVELLLFQEAAGEPLERVAVLGEQALRVLAGRARRTG
jgi:hypothetical protein